MPDFLRYLILSLASNFLCHLGHVAGTQVLRLRGVSVSKSSLYSPESDFECFDGSLRIPFTYVNDDYCDCADGTDEPGTAACSNGLFFCQNTGHRSAYIPGSWVNDGICDCCDASDEYASGTKCVDNCHELGREAKLEAQKAAELIKEGNKIRLEMLTRGKLIKSEHQTRLVKLRIDYEEAERAKKEKEILKKHAEERESVALEKYKSVENDEAAGGDGEEEELRAVEAEEYFKMLDSDANGILTIAELQTRVTFDKDKDGTITEEEAMFFLNNKKEVSLEEFLETSWALVKPFLMLEQGMFNAAGQSEGDNVHEETEEAPEHSTDDSDPADNSQEHEKDIEEPTEEHDDHEEPEVKYDEETQALIDEANGAREKYQEAEKAVNDLQNEMRRLEEKLDRDYGHDEEFASLDGDCFEYSDLEYVYKLCMFGRASQKSKSGGSDVTLGHWHEWVGPEGDKYSKMMYDRGITCWNGPARSVLVNLVCGKENKLVSVTEPSRCEYAMEFATPALCKPTADSNDTHDEL